MGWFYNISYTQKKGVIMNNICDDMIQKRAEKKTEFIEQFKNAKTQADIIQAYAHYCGNLEALCDIYEIERSLKK